MILEDLGNGVYKVVGQVKPYLDAGYTCFEYPPFVYTHTSTASKNGGEYLYNEFRSREEPLKAFLGFRRKYVLRYFYIMKREDWLAWRNL